MTEHLPVLVILVPLLALLAQLVTLVPRLLNVCGHAAQLCARLLHGLGGLRPVRAHACDQCVVRCARRALSVQGLCQLALQVCDQLLALLRALEEVLVERVDRWLVRPTFLRRNPNDATDFTPRVSDPRHLDPCLGLRPGFRSVREYAGDR